MATSKKTTPTPTAWVGAFEALAQSYKAITRHYEPALFFVSVSLAAQVLASILSHEPVLASPIDTKAGLSVVVTQTIVSFLFLPFVIRYALSLARGETATISELLRPNLRLYLMLFLANIVIIAISVAAALPLLIPLIIILPWLFILLFPVVDRGLGPVQAISDCRALVSGHKSKAWGVIGVTLLTIIASALLSPIPILGDATMFAATLLYQTVTAFFYVWLRKQANAPAKTDAKTTAA